jgi:RNA polymerase sigma-70 factor (ECF subfamily)
MDSPTNKTPQRPGAGFEATRWTIVMRARGDSPEAQAALGDLCEAYWDPVYRFLRGEGRDEDSSRELTQAFFARLLARGGIGQVDPEKGRFRSYLLGALKHFLLENRRNQGRVKRGGGATIESLDEGGTETSPGIQIADPASALSTKRFDREWAYTVLERSLKAVQARFDEAGKAPQFAILKPWLTGERENLSQAEAARALGLSAGAVKVAIHRLRSDFHSAVEAEVAQTLPCPDDLADELRYLVEVLR